MQIQGYELVLKDLLQYGRKSDKKIEIPNFFMYVWIGTCKVEFLYVLGLQGRQHQLGHVRKLLVT